MDKLIDIIKGRKSVRTFDGKGLSDPGISTDDSTEYIASVTLR